jgi:hypothetical protein
MTETAGPSLDREIALRAFGEQLVRAPAYSTDNASADLLLWRLAKLGVAFRVQELDGGHFCMLWFGSARPGRVLTTAHAESRPLAIARAVLELCGDGPWPGSGGLRRDAAPVRARA